MDPTIEWIDQKFSARPVIAEANKRALKAGYAFGETTELFHTHYRVRPAHLAPGTYRNITGNEAAALGFLAASKLADRPLFYGSYPITPASDILHQLSGYKAFGVKTFQAEDEIAAIGAAIGASYGGALGLTASSGPGIALKSEAMGLAVMVELPIVIVDVQRAGPSTGMPTKNEQADLLQVLFGRNSDSPMPVLAPATPGDCFDMAIEAWRIALKYMTPVAYLSDAFLATGSEPWRIPAIVDLPDIRVPDATVGEGPFRPYLRDPDTLARPWAVPGTAGLEHRIGGLEKADVTGNVSYDPENHHRMQVLRQAKVAGIARDIAPLEVFGPERGDLLVLGWGSTYGAIRSAVERLQASGRSVAHAHLRHLNPFPTNTEEVLRSYRHVLIPEVNLGQLLLLIRARYLIDAIGYDRVRGKPFRIAEIVAEAERVLGVGADEPSPRSIAADDHSPNSTGGGD
jgi:2-oxoglutarate ferredoxin oxidoreductase subunit alpha